MQNLINIDIISKIMIFLIISIAIIIFKFSKNYMKFENHYYKFFANLALLILSVLIFVIADNIILFFLCFCVMNFVLTQLMKHNKLFEESVVSSSYAFRNFSLSSLFLAIALLGFYFNTKQIQISLINQQYIDLMTNLNVNKFLLILPIIFLILAAVSQSSLLFFHRWLLSSLNSPTPVSAIMHAGIINAGGILLIRFYLVLVEFPMILSLIFAIGIMSAMIGTFFKLMQSNVKNMLACSTVSQMGFMIAQCGLGLFNAAIAHIVLHGFFKTYLFLSSSKVEKLNNQEIFRNIDFKYIFIAIFIAIFGAISFAFASQKDFSVASSNYIFLVVALIAISQLNLAIIKKNQNFWFQCFAISFICGIFYGLSINLVTYFFADYSKPQNLNSIHFIAIIFMFLLMILSNIRVNFWKSEFMKKLFLKLYVKGLNASKPYKSTISM